MNAVAYDAASSIIGGGFTHLKFLPANGQSGVEIGLITTAPPAKVELYPTLSGLSVLKESTAAPSPLQLIAQGFGQSSGQVGVAFLLENRDPSQAIERTEYQVTAYDAGGQVLKTKSGYVDLVFPGAVTAVFCDFYLTGELQNSTVAQVIVQVKPGEPANEPLIPQSPFTVEDARFIPDRYAPEITGVLKSSFDLPITTVRVDAVAYDEAGNIIGGGYTYVDLVPAQGQVRFEMSAIVGARPARIEFYPSITTLSELEP